MRIMIVEDDVVIRESLAGELMKWNYDVVAVDTFDDIVSCFVKYEPGLVLLDINLPISLVPRNSQIVKCSNYFY